MIRSLMVQEYKAHQIMAVFGMLALKTLLIAWRHDLETGPTSNEGDNSFGDNIDMRCKRYHIDKFVVLAVSWGDFTVWSQLTENDGWKVLTDED